MKDILRPMCNPGIVFLAALLIHSATVVFLNDWQYPKWVEDGAIASSMYDGKGFSIWPKAEQRFYTMEAKSRAAEKVARGGRIPFSELHPTSLHAPGYPFFLFILWKLFGRGPTGYLAISIIQALLASSMVFPLYWLTRRWFGEKSAALAMWITCLLPIYAWYATRFFSVAVFIPLHPWLLLAWVRLKEQSSPGRGLLAGCCTGLAALFQPMVLAIFGLLGLAGLARALMAGQTRAILGYGLAAMVVMLVLAPWTIRNYRVNGEFMVIRSGAGPFWVGNNPHANGTAVIEGGRQDVYVAFPPQCVSLGTELDETAYHRALRQEALDYIGHAPGAFIGRTLKKVAWFWTWVPEKFVNRAFEKPGLKFRMLQIGYWVILVALAVGAWMYRRPFPADYRLILCIYVLVGSVTYGLLHVGQARFRGEIEYIFIPAAACGLAVAFNCIKRALVAGKSHS